jgi:flagellar hook-associated protein FlgK
VGVNNISIINSAYSALEVASAGMTVTSQNVAGSSIDGFTRRQSNSIISHRALNSWDFGNTAFSVEGFSRFTDRLLDSQMRDQKSKSSYTSSLLQVVNGLDTAMMDPANSISEALSSFFNAAGTLASNTSSTTNIQNFAAEATRVAAKISGFSESLKEIDSSTRANLTAILEEANSIAPALAKINLNILMGSVPGNATPSADILDERDRLTMRLQDLLGGKTIIQPNGTATFQIGGVALVDGQSANQFVDTDVSTSVFTLKMQSSDGLKKFEIGTLSSEGAILTDANGHQYRTKTKTAFTGGQAGAAFTVLTDFLPRLQRQINSISLVLMRDVNAIKQKDGSAITPIFGYTKVTSSSSVEINKTAPAALGSYTATELMDLSDPTSRIYNEEIAKIVSGYGFANGDMWAPSLFVSNSVTPSSYVINVIVNCFFSILFIIF